MSKPAEFWRRLLHLRGNSAVDAELAEEMRQHLEMKVQANMRTGMAPQEARFEAQREFGNRTRLHEESRELWRWRIIENFFRDLRFGLRVLRKSPGFTAIAVLTLALGIGANAAIFSVVEAQLWRPLPYPDSERLVEAHLVLRERSRQWDVLPVRVFEPWRSESRSFTDLTGYLYPQSRNLTANGSSERVRVMAVTANFFDTLGLPPQQGRAFSSEEEKPGRDHLAILSHALWENRFGSDPGLLGKPVTIDGEAYFVVGVASPSLTMEYFSDEPAIYVPLAMEESRVLRNLYTIGRLAPGVTPEGAQTELETILQRQLKAEPIQPEPAAAVGNLRETWTAFAAAPLYFFAGAVALVLLIACVNTAGLLLARGLARQREFALRAALGAGMGTLIRQSLVESLLLSLGGSAAGTLLGVWLVQAMSTFIPADTLPRRAPVEFDTRVLLFALVISVASALLVGLVPGILASHVDCNRVLGQNSRSFTAGRSQRRMRSTLVSIEVALGLVLLFGAGLFLTSFERLQEAPRGFDAPGALTFRVALRGNDYSKPEQMQRYFSQLSDKLASLPGVREVTLGSGLPLAGSDLWGNVNVAGRPPVSKYGLYMDIYAVTPNYFQALHMHMLAGRVFDLHDDASSMRVGIINRNAAKELFGSEDPLGKVLEYVAAPGRGVPAEPPVQIVGVVENSEQFGANEIPFEFLYVPFAQKMAPSAYALLYSDQPRGTLSGAIRATAYDIDKNQPVYDLKTMDERQNESVRGARFNLVLVAGLAGVAMILVAIGIFGTVSYFVEQRTQEFGIRLALGASPRKLLGHAIGQSLLTGATGLALGVATSLALGRLLRHALYLVPHEHTGMLYGVSIYDPLSMLGAGGVLFAALVLASYVPARRAMRVDPMVALRHE
jgi:putative ABC transport system permease protein